MARSLLQRRLENKRQRVAALDAALKHNHRRVKSCDDHEIALTLEWVSDHKPHLIRSAADWNPRLKTRDESRVTLAAARHLFARFPAPAHLERIWLETAGLVAAIHGVQLEQCRRFSSPLPQRSTNMDSILKYCRPTTWMAGTRPALTVVLEAPRRAASDYEDVRESRISNEPDEAPPLLRDAVDKSTARRLQKKGKRGKSPGVGEL